MTTTKKRLSTDPGATLKEVPAHVLHIMGTRSITQVQIPTRTPEKIVVALFSGILVNSGIQVEAGRQINVKLLTKGSIALY